MMDHTTDSHVPQDVGPSGMDGGKCRPFGPAVADLVAVRLPEPLPYALYAFVLATRTEHQVLDDIINYFNELGNITGDVIFIGLPYEAWKIVKKLNLDPDQFKSLGEKPTVSDTDRLHQYAQTVMAESSDDFQKALGLRLQDFPCVVFFDTQDETRRMVRWSLADYQEGDLVRDFRQIRDKIDELSKGPRDNVDFLNEIRALQEPSLQDQALRTLKSQPWVGILI